MPATVAVAIATRVRLLPEVVDISLVPTLAGVFSIVFAAVGAACRFPPERIGRLTLLGTLFGAASRSSCSRSPPSWRYSRDHVPEGDVAGIAPYLAIACALVLAAMVAYENGAPAWVVHLGRHRRQLFVVLPGYLRWDKRHYGD